MRIIGLVMLCWLLAFPAHADDPSRTIVRGIVDSTGSHAGETLIIRDLTGVNQVTVTCYYWAPPGNVCAGGGDFDDAGTCDPGSDNGATIIRNSTNQHCWYRKNFGLNGVVDARQCGVIGDGLPAAGSVNTPGYHPDDGLFLQNCLTVAANNGIPVVNTGGGVILDNTIQLQVPGGVELTCGGTSPSGNGGNDFRVLNDNGKPNISNALAISPQIPGPGSSILTTAILFSGKGASLRGCLELASDGGGTSPVNPYAPSVWYPGCDPAYTGCIGHDTGTGHVRSATLEYSAFSPNRSVAYPTMSGGPAAHSIGIQVGDLTTGGGSQTTIKDVTVVGFGTSIFATASGLIVDNVAVDGDTGINLTNLDTPHLSNWSAGPQLTTGDIAELALSAGSGFEFTNDGLNQYKVVVEIDPAAPDYRVRNGDVVWVSPVAGAESATGKWTAQCIEVSSACPVLSGSGGCPAGKTCQSFSLAGSVYSITGTGGTSLTGSVTGGSTAVTGLSFFTSTGGLSTLGASFIAPGQRVSDTGHCILPGTKVADVWPARGIVYLTLLPSTSCASDTITFQDNSYSGSPSCTGTNSSPKGCVVVDASFRYGDGLSANNAGGFRIDGCTSFEHQVSFHMSAGTRGDIANCATGNNIGLPDRNLAALHGSSTDTNLNGNIVSLLIEGKHQFTAMTGSDFDSCGIKWTSGVLGQHRTAAVVVQSNCKIADTFANVDLSVDNHGSSGIGLELDAGTVLMANSGSGTGSDVFKADQGILYDQTTGGTPHSYPASMNASNNSLPGANFFFENTNAQTSTAGCGNVFLAYISTPATTCGNSW